MSGEFSQIKESLVDKILEQGQKLRNAMVKSILQNDPLGSDIFDKKTYNTPASSAATLSDKTSDEKKLLEAFLSGDYLTRVQEETALKSIRSMPLSDVCKATEANIGPKCSCYTCSAYQMNNLKCDLRRSKCYTKQTCTPQNGINSNQILKQVDSLKVVLQSIHLNNLGNKKVTQSSSKKQVKSILNETYFVEYYIPEVFNEEIPKSISKTDSRSASNHVRVCARRTDNVIHLKNIFIHSVCNLYDCNLDDHDITFFIRYKSTGQKNSELLGIAKFNLGAFKNISNVSCGKTLPIYLNEESPITVGKLKVTLLLGAGRLYFGQEFLDAVLSRKNSLDTDSSEEIIEHVAQIVSRDTPVYRKVVPERANKKEYKSDKTQTNSSTQTVPALKPDIIQRTALHKKEIKSNFSTTENKLEGEVLFGFLYISEAQFLNKSPNSFILCQPYCQNDTSASRVVFNSSNPLYNFCQSIPLLYEESLLLSLRENFMVIEFWEKCEQADRLFGLTRLPLHQFYLGYRNCIILKHLKKNKLPIIGTDWWEGIYNADNDELIGQVQVLTALGTEEQINNLERERGFKDDIVIAKKLPFAYKKIENTKQHLNYFGDRARVNKKVSTHLALGNNKTLTQARQPVTNPVKSEISTTKAAQKIDVGVQSEINTIMDIKDNPKPPQTQDMLASFLKLLEQRERPPCVENSTNTDNAVSSSSSCPVPKTDPSLLAPLRKTSDLLDSLQKALSLESRPSKKVEKPPHFKALISINGANQLPSRRKIKTKKHFKGKSPKQEDNVLPSTYVTFETLPGEPLQITGVCPKSTSPQWHFKCEVCLPVDLLTNGQKRLIFKVWKKCTNAVLQPNMQTDLVLGFAALDLSVLSVGLPNIQGWFNIIDFSGKCNGQINIHVNPLEKIEKLSAPHSTAADRSSDPSASHLMSENEECNELLSRALKRKFTELDEITQRLRLRLSEVVSEDSEGSNDDIITDEFEHDINNLCIEEDFDLVNFEEEARKFNINYNNQKTDKKEQLSGTSNDVSAESKPGSNDEIKETHQVPSSNRDVSGDKLKSDSSGILSKMQSSGSTTESSTSRSLFSDKQLTEGKHRIDSLLEKLSLITAEASQPFSNRYVSGCSAVSTDHNDVQDILIDLEQHSRPNITAANDFDPVLFQQLYGGSASNSSVENSNSLNIGLSKNGCSDNRNASGGSETSVITNFSDCRPIPEGQGTISDDKGT